MSLNIGFVAEVEPVQVAKPREARIVRIVARTDHIDVVPLQDPDVANHMLKRGSVSEQRVAVMSVNALRLDLFSVDEDRLVFDFDLPEPERLTNDFARSAECEDVERRVLVRPESGRHDGRKDDLAGTIDRRLSFGDLGAVGRQERIIECYGGVRRHLNR